MAVVELDPEHRVREGLDDGAFNLDDVVCFCHKKTGPELDRTGNIRGRMKLTANRSAICPTATTIVRAEPLGKGFPRGQAAAGASSGR